MLEYTKHGKRHADSASFTEKNGPNPGLGAMEEYTGLNPGDERAILLPGGAKMVMVWCPPGEFMMGSPGDEAQEWNGKPQHRVILTKGFWLAKTEVTQRQWQSVMRNNPSYFKGDDLPVESVSWDDCQEFCRKTGLRLPTEVEWEYACRAGDMGPDAAPGSLDTMGWYENNSGGQTHPVGQKRPNAWGLFDIHGNVYEWCQDWYGDDYPSGVDPVGPSAGTGRVVRGGGWHCLANGSCCKGRNMFDSGVRNRDVGFRPVLSPP